MVSRARFLADHPAKVVYAPIATLSEERREQLTAAEWSRIGSYVSRSLSDNTRRAYRSAWTDFSYFCKHNKLRSLPASPETIALYISTLANGKDGHSLKKASIAARVAAISSIHEMRFGLQDDNYINPANGRLVKRTLSGIGRAKREVRQRQVRAITLVELSRMLNVLRENASDAADLVVLRDSALLLVGFHGAFRRSELVALTRGAVEILPDGMVLSLSHSKTDQIGAGSEKVIPRADNGFCPVGSLEQWIAAADIRPSQSKAPIFRAIDQWGNVGENALSDRSVANIIQRAAGLANLPAADFSGHSLRAGFVTEQLAHGVGEIPIMDMTGHKSVNTLRKYYRPMKHKAKNAGERRET